MIRPLLLTLLLVLPLTLLAQDEAKPPKKPAKGTPDREEGEPGLDQPFELWAGRWDSGLLVFLRVFGPSPDWKNGFTETRVSNQYQPDGGLYYTRLGAKKKPAGYSTARNYIYRLGLGDNPKIGLIYDENGKGRMANLVKIEEPVDDIDVYDPATGGWTAAHLPPEEARRIILGADADLLGQPTVKVHAMRTAADEVLVDARLLQEAKDKWVAQGNDPAKVTWWDIKPFIHAENRVAMRECKDLYGRVFTLGNATEGVKVNPATHALLREAYPDVWGNFAPAP
jgi:hypothetical protein